MIDVVIPMSNMWLFPYLKNCCNAIFNQNYLRKNLEIIVSMLFDGKEDISPLAKYCRDIEATLIFRRWRDPAFSISRAKNIGARHCSRKYIAFIDCDLVIHPNTFKVALPFLDKNFMVIIPVGRMQQGPDSYIYTGVNNKEWLKLTENAPYSEWGVANAIFSKKLFEQIHGYDERFYGWGGEDNDIHKRVIKHGIKVVNLIDYGFPKAMHQNHPITPTKESDFTQRNRTIIAKSNKVIRNPDGWGDISLKKKLIGQVKPTISVVIPISSASYITSLECCLQSIRAQTYQREFVDIIVTYLCKDKINEEIEGVKILCTEFDTVVKIHKYNKSFWPPSLLRNVGIRESTGQIIACVDVDAVLDPRTFDKAVEFIVNDNAAVHVKTRLLRQEPGSPIFRDLSINKFEENARLGSEAKGPGCCIMASRDAVFEIRGWDENFVGYGPADWDYVQRLEKVTSVVINLSKRCNLWNLHQDHERNINKLQQLRNRAYFKKIRVIRDPVRNFDSWGGSADEKLITPTRKEIEIAYQDSRNISFKEIAIKKNSVKRVIRKSELTLHKKAIVKSSFVKEKKFDKNLANQDWEQKGDLQLRFLISSGLKPYHKLLDIGCGKLRGGIKFIWYLDEGNYWGFDNNSKVIEEVKNMKMSGYLDKKKPNIFLIKGFDLSRFSTKRFDFVVAFSLFNYLSQLEIKKCLKTVMPLLNESFFATFDESKSQIIRYDSSYSGKIKYPFSFFDKLARDMNIKIEYIGSWRHPLNAKGYQMMVRFANKKIR